VYLLRKPQITQITLIFSRIALPPRLTFVEDFDFKEYENKQNVTASGDKAVFEDHR